MTSITSLCEMACTFVQKKLEEKQLEEERAAKAHNWKLPICHDDDDDEERSDSLDDNIISGLPPFSAITPNDNIISGLPPFSAITPSEPVLSIEEPDNSLKFSSFDDDSFSIDDIDYVEASPSNPELVSSEVMEIVIPKVGGIKASNDNPIPFYDPIISGTPPNLTPSGESDFFLEVDAFLVVEDEFTSSQFPKSYLDPEGDMLLLEAFLNDDHTSDFQTKSSSTYLNSLLEETHNFDNSLPEFTTFSKVPFDAEYESDFSDDQSCSDEDVLENIVPFDAEYESDSSDDQSCSDEDVLENIVSKPLCEKEIIPMKSLRTYDSSLPISSKIDSLLDEFAGELTLLKL
nr:hypothetical protein [Tanacetum cinerariifolium]